MRFQAVQQIGGKAEIPLHEILRVFRAVHTGKVEDKIGFAAVFVQFLGSGVQIVLEDLINMDTGAAAIFAVPDVFQIVYKGGAHHALCPGHKDIHLILPPHHFVDDIHIALNDANHLHGNGLVHIVGTGLAQHALSLHLDRHIGGVEKLTGGNAGKNEVAGFQCLGALGAGADAHSGDGVTDGQVEAALLRQRAGVRHDGKGVHLQLVVVVKAKRLIDTDAGIQPKTALLQFLSGAGMAGVEDRHIVFFRQSVDGGEQTFKVFVGVDVFLPVRGKQDVLVLFQPQTFQHIRGMDLIEIATQYLCHGRAGHIGALLGHPHFVQIFPGRLGIGQIYIGDHVYDAAVGLLWQTFVLAAVASLHVKNGDVQPLCGDGRQAGIGIAQNQQRVGRQFIHDFIGLRENVPAGLPQMAAYHMEQNIRAKLPCLVFQLKVLPEHGGEILVPVLVGIDDAGVKILPAALHHRSQPNDLRPRAADHHDLQPAVIFPSKVVFHNILHKQAQRERRTLFH